MSYVTNDAYRYLGDRVERGLQDIAQKLHYRAEVENRRNELIAGFLGEFKRFNDLKEYGGQ